jgi:hypothetical protein
MKPTFVLGMCLGVSLTLVAQAKSAGFGQDCGELRKVAAGF